MWNRCRYRPSTFSRRNRRDVDTGGIVYAILGTKPFRHPAYPTNPNLRWLSQKKIEVLSGDIVEIAAKSFTRPDTVRNPSQARGA
ncbi:hypothetical protein GCM10011611_66380 [Aliidongia dinghuensis]|uniref:Uncharacterized protein n=1 Tax=Aliidongia dinghuensis TaxID=1867774 RepID=A0A8J2Z0L5_9PROT|nr:hypothetical protein GCM10011611_66380 [Aliidongia dinghuensis]